MVGCPLEGVATDSIVDAGPALRATVERYIGDPEYSNLPRKFKTSISGCARHCTNHEINDLSFVGVRNQTWRPILPGRMSAGSSRSSGTFVAPMK